MEWEEERRGERVDVGSEKDGRRGGEGGRGWEVEVLEDALHFLGGDGRGGVVPLDGHREGIHGCMPV